MKLWAGRFQTQTDELVNEQFALGLVNTLDLLNAHSSLLTAQQELLQAKYLTILN